MKPGTSGSARTSGWRPIYQGDALRAAEQTRIDIAYRLAASVDFIAAHILPYWDRATAPQAVEHTLDVYNKLRKMHEGKRIVIAEFGWPSGGYNRQESGAGPHGAGHDHPRVRDAARKRARHRLQRHRSLRSAVEEL